MIFSLIKTCTKCVFLALIAFSVSATQTGCFDDMETMKQTPKASLGMILQPDPEGALVVVAMVKASPAVNAGLKIGDRIIKLANFKQGEANLLEKVVCYGRKQKIGAAVSLVVSNAEKEVNEITLTYESVNLANADWEESDFYKNSDSVSISKARKN